MTSRYSSTERWSRFSGEGNTWWSVTYSIYRVAFENSEQTPPDQNNDSMLTELFTIVRLTYLILIYFIVDFNFRVYYI